MVHFITTAELARMYTPEELDVIFQATKARLAMSELCREVTTTKGVTLEIIQQDMGHGADSKRTMDPHQRFGKEGTIADDKDSHEDIYRF
jgi:hypothetical protein